MATTSISKFADSTARPRGDGTAVEGSERPVPAHVRSILDEIERSPTELVTLDFFDTLVARTCCHFKDVFIETGRLLKSRNLAPQSLNEFAFREIRWKAEQLVAARARESGAGAIRMTAIYERILPHCPPGASIESMIGCEWDADRCTQFAVRSLWPLLRELRARNIPFAVVSNTPYTSDHLRRFLAALDWPEELVPDRIYASSEHDCSKHSGLFEIVLKKERLAPGEVVHVGDNPKTDIVPAEKLGMRPYHFALEALYGPAYGKMRGDEHRVARPPERAHPVLGLVDGARVETFGAIGARAEVKPDDYEKYGAAVVGPLTTLFARWVARQRPEGAPLVFFEREGVFLHELTGALGALKPGDRVLPASRLALVHACVRLAAVRDDDRRSVR